MLQTILPTIPVGIILGLIVYATPTWIGAPLFILVGTALGIANTIL